MESQLTRKSYLQRRRLPLEAEERWNEGDWRTHVEKLTNGSVALLLTDPPYGMDFQSDHKLDRREERRHEPIVNDGKEDALVEMADMLAAFMSKLADNAHVLFFCQWRMEPLVRRLLEHAGLKVRGSLVWVKNSTGMGDPSTTFAPQHERILHAVKGSPLLFHRASDVLHADRIVSDDHPTEKPVSLLRTMIEATTVEGALVADPFGGVASTLVAARDLKREWWGCELNRGYFESGKRRLFEGGK